MKNINLKDSQSSQVFIVQASAGSGKTYALAKRYIGLLINSPGNLEENLLKNILAITFTNKATVEMKERILELLKRIALDSFSSEQERQDILSLFTIDKKSVQAKAAYIMNTLIRHYNFFQVKTIDSFINALLLGCALQIERSASFKVNKDYTEHLCYCFDLVMEEAAADKAIFEFMEEFLEHYLFVENRKSWFPKEDILKLIKSLFGLSNNYGRIFGKYKGSGRDLIKKREQIYNQIKEIASLFPEGMNGTAKKSINKFLGKNDHIFNIGSLPLALNSPSVPMNKGKAAPLDFRKRWADTYKALVKLTELDATVVYNPYIKLFGKLFDFFQAVSKKEDTLFMEELNSQARRLFDEEGITVAELYYRLATKFRHFLIDEFQDTSCLQWQNLEMMVEEALANNGSLFYVGDKKQAIYRFRGGEVNLFDDVKEKFSHFNVKHNYLTKNWRSQKAIVEFNNKVFSQENLCEALGSSGIGEIIEKGASAVSDIIDIFKDGPQQHKEENAFGYVQVKYIDEENQQDRDSIMRGEVLSLIAELRKDNRFQYSDLAILTRDNDEVERVSGWLLEAGVAVESEKTLNVTQNSLVKEIIALLKFLYSPIDDLSFAAFILGRIFSKATSLPNKTITDFIFSLHRQGKLNSGVSFYRLFREQFGDVWEQYFETLLKIVGFISPYELLIRIYQQFDLLNSFADNQGFFMKLAQLIKAKEDECVGLGEFLSYLETAPLDELYVNVTHSDSVKVLTIHKSKGLEFGVVIIPFLRMDIKPETGGEGTSSYVIPETSGQLGLVRITRNHYLYSEKLYKIYAENYKKACIDELNSIYVALTRPKYELYIFIPNKSARSKNKVRYFIPEGVEIMGSKRKYKHKEKDPQPIINVKPSLYKDWIAHLSNEFVDINSVKNREKISQGVVFHFMFSCIDNLHNQNKEDTVRKAFRRTKDMYPSIVKDQYLEEKISSLLDDDNIKPFFYVKEGVIYREKEVVNASGHTRRLDRLIVKDKRVQVIDYKLTADFKEKYQDQVKEYMSIVKDIYKGKVVEGFILYIEEARVEQVNLGS